MKFLDKYFNKEKTSLNYQSILIVTYGRSGSTLLLSLLNKIDGVIIRGENFNMCFHMFQTYQSILKTKAQKGRLTQSPFYGAELLDEVYYLKQMRETVKTLLLANKKNDESIRCYGFKEIRYESHLELLPEFLDFLQKIFPKVCFIFNTRKKEDVAKSWISLKWKTDKEECIRRVEEMDTAFSKYIKLHQKNSFHIAYEDIIGKTERLKSLYSFLGAQYQEKKVDDVLAYKHSYNPNQDHVDKLPNKKRFR